MGQIKEVAVSDLLFWLENFRFGQAKDQDKALELLQETKYFNNLVQSIREYGFQENNILTVSAHKKIPKKYIVFDGNRRLAAIKQIPEIKKIRVWVEEDTKALKAILDRKHGSGNKASSLKWTSVQQARRDISLYEQELMNELSDNAFCLRVLETAKKSPIKDNFYLTTFARLRSGFQGFDEQFGISDDGKEVIKSDLIKHIFDDIEKNDINSRNINTSNNINQYLKNVLAGKSKGDRTKSIIDDRNADEEIREDEENNPSRLLRPSMIEKLEQHVKNRKFISELKDAPIRKYPNLLFFALRSILDTLGNIDNKNQKVPKSLSAQDAKNKYLSENEKNILKK